MCKIHNMGVLVVAFFFSFVFEYFSILASLLHYIVGYVTTHVTHGPYQPLRFPYEIHGMHIQPRNHGPNHLDCVQVNDATELPCSFHQPHVNNS